MLFEQIASLSSTIPAPTGGLNKRDALDLMPETDAVEMDNWFPDTDSVRLRRGHTLHLSGLGGDVQTLFELTGADGSELLIACANNTIYNASSTASDITGSTTPTEDMWQHVVYKNTAILVNGVDQPQQISSAGSVSDASYTGIADDSVLVAVCSYRDRLYFIEKDSLSFWYTDSPNALTGAISEFPLDRIASRGGYLQFIANWTRESGSGTDDFLVLGTNKGEIFVYTGPNPEDGAWTLVGRFYIPVPLGRRCAFNLGPDLVVITEQGALPMSSVLSAGSVYTYNTLSDKIQKLFIQTAKSAQDNFGWQGVVYPRGNYALINVPVSAGVRTDQYVINTLTGAWCRFRGQLGNVWCLHKEKLYFGDPSGRIFIADMGDSDNGAEIVAFCQQGFSYLGDRAKMKHVTMARPVMLASSGASLTYDISADFDTRKLTNAISVAPGEGAEWNTAEWDTAEWAEDIVPVMDWTATAAIGRAIGVQFGGSFADVEIQITAHQVIYEQGGYL